MQHLRGGLAPPCKWKSVIDMYSKETCGSLIAIIQLTIPRSLLKSSAKDLSPATLEFGIGSALGVFVSLGYYRSFHITARLAQFEERR